MNIKALRIMLGVFFIVLGILGILPQFDEGIFNLNNRNYVLELIFGIVETVCGIIILGGFTQFLSGKKIATASLIVLIFWIARVVLSKFIWGQIPVGSTGLLLVWVLYLVVDLIIMSGIWVLHKVYD